MDKEKKALGEFAKLIQDGVVSMFGGSVNASSNMTTLYTKNGRQATFFTFPFPSSEEMQSLYNTAQPASFGVGNEAVMDKTYRSARTLVTEDFAINLRPDQALLDQINQLMFEDNEGFNSSDNENSKDYYVRAELYRVNVYGPGDFFKEHQDTPQGGSGHFGSLVYCLPSVFEGGALVVKNPKGEEVKFDWADKYANGKATPDAADSGGVAAVEFAAFASDLTHWVEPVTTGYRVTVTFHLYRQTKLTAENTVMEAITSSWVLQREDRPAVVNLVALRASSDKLAGKEVVFHLVHQYAARSSKEVVLKGGDAALFQMLKNKFNVNPRIMFFYYFDDEGEDEYEDEYEDENEYDEDNNSIKKRRCEEETSDICVAYLTTEVKTFTNTGLYDGDRKPIRDLADRHQVIMARDPQTYAMSLSIGGRYGNQPTMEEYWGNVCILTTW